MQQKESQVEAIKERIDIVTVVERYVKLKKAGKNFTGLCPFHTEKTPSFNVSPDIQIFKCFGCGKSGDVFTFLQEIEKIDFPEALEKLAKEAGIELKSHEANEPFKLYYEVHALAVTKYREALRANKEAVDYLKQRGFTKDDVNNFKVGYAPGGDFLLKIVQEKYKFSREQLLRLGLFVEREKIRDKFGKRVLFPIFSTRGKYIGFTGRVLPSNTFGPKYLHTPETPIFHKSQNLYGLYQAKSEIRREDLCIFCEGTTDVISAHRNGIKNIVAPLGTSLTSEQLDLASQFTQNMLFIFDSDLAGQKALERAFILAERKKLNTFAINTLPYKDIDEMLLKDVKGFKEQIRNRTDTFTYLMSNKLETLNLTKLQDAVKFKEYSQSLLNSVIDFDRRNFYESRLKGLTGENSQSISQGNYQQSGNNAQKSGGKRINLEEYYLKALLQSELLTIPESHDLSIFSNQSIVEILSVLKDNPGISPKQLHKKLPVELHLYYEDISLTNNHINAGEVETIYKRILKAKLDDDIKILRLKLAAAESQKDREKISDIMEKVTKLALKLKEDM